MESVKWKGGEGQIEKKMDIDGKVEISRRENWVTEALAHHKWLYHVQNYYR